MRRNKTVVIVNIFLAFFWDDVHTCVYGGLSAVMAVRHVRGSMYLWCSSGVSAGV